MGSDRHWWMADNGEWQTMRWKQWWMTDNGEYQIIDDRQWEWQIMRNGTQYEMKTMVNDRQWRLSDDGWYTLINGRQWGITDNGKWQTIDENNGELQIVENIR